MKCMYVNLVFYRKLQICRRVQKVQITADFAANIPANAYIHILYHLDFILLYYVTECFSSLLYLLTALQ